MKLVMCFLFFQNFSFADKYENDLKHNIFLLKSMHAIGIASDADITHNINGLRQLLFKIESSKTTQSQKWAQRKLLQLVEKARSYYFSLPLSEEIIEAYRSPKNKKKMISKMTHFLNIIEKELNLKRGSKR